jgi:hypothetical protein
VTHEVQHTEPAVSKLQATCERFKPALPVGDPVDFFRQATAAGCPTLMAYFLPRDFWNMSLRECQQV